MPTFVGRTRLDHVVTSLLKFSDQSTLLDVLLRFALAVDAVESVLATMNERTFVNIVLLESEVGVLCGVPIKQYCHQLSIYAEV